MVWTNTEASLNMVSLYVIAPDDKEGVEIDFDNKSANDIILEIICCSEKDLEDRFGLTMDIRKANREYD